MAKRIEIPERFLAIRYNGDHYPGAPGVIGLIGGANCQRYAYEILRHFGLQIPDYPVLHFFFSLRIFYRAYHL
jgi:hypothetical protein